MTHSATFFLRSLFTVMCFLLGASHLSADKDKELKRSAEALAQKIANLKLQRLYVPDFLGSDATRTDRGAYLAAAFRKALAEQAGNNFEVVDRAVVQRSYDSLGLTAHDLEQKEVLTRLGFENGADAILWGTISQMAKEITIDLSLSEARSGKVLYSLPYQQPRTPQWEALFPAEADPSGRVFYFSGFDGVGVPKPIHSPPPSYTDEARRHKVNGTVLLSAVITIEGRVEQVRVVQSLEASLDQASIDIVRSWKINPAKDAAGHPVPIRAPIETTFRLY
jgi:TonB family protein